MSTPIEQVDGPQVGAEGHLPQRRFLLRHHVPLIGLKLDLFTPMFAMSRISGWSGPLLEQLGDNRLYRPAAKYVGPHDQRYVPMDKHGVVQSVSSF